MSAPSTQYEPLITYKEVATRLGFTPSGIKKMVARRAIPVIKLNHQTVRFRWSEVQAALERLTVREVR